MNDHIKYPRLFVSSIDVKNKAATLGADQAHYLKAVLRSNTGDHVRVFNSAHGEWVATISELSKKSAEIQLQKQIRTPEKPPQPLHLLFPPIKKNRMDFMIEKAVELGVTDLHPVITAHTQIPKIKPERIEAQIIEAAEQCERLDIPTLHKMQNMDQKVTQWSATPHIYCALERDDTLEVFSKENSPKAFLIGPEGGFSATEREFLKSSEKTKNISLGQRILRAETAALYCLSLANG